MTTERLGFQEQSLVQQGYDDTAEHLKKLEWGLRFTPTVCMLAALVGLVTGNYWIHFTLAALGIVPFWFPAWHPVDKLYNAVIRPLWGGVALPPNPLPRRIACLIGGAMNLGIGLAFLGGQPVVAYILGVVLVPLQLVVITTHFCVASWLYENALKLMGRWTAPVSPERARELVRGGARLVDVRAPHEFAREHLPGAVNVPVDELSRRCSEIADRPVVVCCQSGGRSQDAVQRLKRLGWAEVYNLGAMGRWYDAEAEEAEKAEEAAEGRGAGAGAGGEGEPRPPA